EVRAAVGAIRPRARRRSRRLGAPGARRPRAGALERAQQGLDDVGVELRARAALELAPRGLGADPLPVYAVAGHRLVRVRHGEDARLERNLVVSQPAGIAAAVGTLVMGEDPAPDVVELGSSEDARADLRVLAHLGVLVVGERARLAQNRVGHADLPDVVEDARHAHAFDLVVRQPELAGHQLAV